ncbi:MAG: phage major capsid protein [Candidatus Melainabacteria bacterium]|nr:phage major capsid protein [Candidatus Melainabacteria bacterium]
MPQETANHYQEKYIKALNEARSILDTAKKENRDFTGEELTAYNRAKDEVARYKELAKDEVEFDKEQRHVDKSKEVLERAIRPGVEAVPAKSEKEAQELRYLSHAVREVVRKKPDLFTDETRAQEFAEFLRTGVVGLKMHETRAQQADLGVVGGYFLPPISMIAGIMKNVDDLVQLRSVASKFQVALGQDLGQIELTDDADDFDFTSELATGNLQSDLTFGKRVLKTQPLAKRVKISNKLIAASTIDFVSYVMSRLSYKLGSTEEQAMMTHNGVNGPLGLFVAHSAGIPSSRDVATGNTTAAATFDGLKNAKWALKPQYRVSPSLRWLFNSDALLKLDLEKDANDHYIWQPSVIAGEPDKVLNIPVIESRFCPNTFVANAYVGMLGDFSYLYIVDAMNMQIKVLNEMYAEQNQTGFILRSEFDARPMLAEAFVRVKLAAS